MKNHHFSEVTLKEGYLFDKEEMNRKITMQAVYDRFCETGRITAFDLSHPVTEGPLRPHHFWDSDVAKWIEGAANMLYKREEPELLAKAEQIIDNIERYQGEDGYFNIYFTAIEPNGRFQKRDMHELYCAGHLIEAAVAYAEATGRERFLHLMEKYVEYIARVFMDRDPSLITPAFETPGHEEIELALIRLYRYTKNPRHLSLAAHFINLRGTVEEQSRSEYNQSHLPVREQTEALGHTVRALYLYTAMADLARETNDEALLGACRTLFSDIERNKMYITGGIGSSPIGEAFTTPLDLPSDTAYTETCAAIAMLFFASRMQELEQDSRYADMIERVLYNGLLSGISLDGRHFFYENPLEINLSERFQNAYGARRFPITERVECFSCSCCPPNLNRLLSSIGGYLFSSEGDTLFVHQYTAAALSANGIACDMHTDYPRDGEITLSTSGVRTLALRIPSWCRHFTLDRPYTMQNGYALVECNETPVKMTLEMTPRLVYPDPRALRIAHKVAVMRGPVVYCAEGHDNPGSLHTYTLREHFTCREEANGAIGLPTLSVSAERHLPGDTLYTDRAPAREECILHLIPYSAFANRGKSDMLIWFGRG